MSPDLSIIVPVYNEDPGNISLMVERLRTAIAPTGLTHEIIYVNDGSYSQETCVALRAIAERHTHIKLLELSRNFGQPAALSAGLKHAEGQAVVNIDSDLQDPPELIPEMVRLWREGYDVVYAMRSKRRDRPLKKLTAYIYYRLLKHSSGVRIPVDTGEYRLMDRKVVDAFNMLTERTRFVRGLVPWLGFKQIGIPMDRDARLLGKSQFTPRRLFALALDGLVSFSSAPLMLMPLFGAMIAVIGLLVGVANLFAGAAGTAGAYAGLVIFFIGVQIAATGVVAVYLAKTFDEVRGRPNYIVSKRLGRCFGDAQDNLIRSVDLNQRTGDEYAAFNAQPQAEPAGRK